MTDNEALELLLKYNTQPFHIKHALTVSEVMRYFAQALGYADQADFWAQAGLLHDIDYELWPQEHCIKARELLEAAGAPQALIHAVVSHGYGITVDVKPEHEMEKVLYATDELTGLIGAAAAMHPSKSVSDLEVKSVRKKYKSKGFAAGCSREVIGNGAQMLGWELDTLLARTLLAMQSCEAEVPARTAQLTEGARE